MPGRRTPSQKGLPKKALRTERLEKVKQIRLLMSTGRWRGELSREALREQWGCSEHTVAAYAEEASRSIQLDVEEGAEELLRRLYLMSEDIAAECRERADNDKEISHKDWVALHGMALQAAGGMAALLGRNPEAFFNPKQRTGGMGGTPGRQQAPKPAVVINVIRKDAAPAQPAASGGEPPTGNKPPTG